MPGSPGRCSPRQLLLQWVFALTSFRPVQPPPLPQGRRGARCPSWRCRGARCFAAAALPCSASQRWWARAGRSTRWAAAAAWLCAAALLLLPLLPAVWLVCCCCCCGRCCTAALASGGIAVACQGMPCLQSSICPCSHACPPACLPPHPILPCAAQGIVELCIVRYRDSDSLYVGLQEAALCALRSQVSTAQMWASLARRVAGWQDWCWRGSRACWSAVFSWCPSTGRLTSTATGSAGLA